MEGQLTIKWFGHSCFSVSYADYTIVLDPYADNVVPGLPPLRVAGSQILCSHDHRDHNCRETVALVVTGPPSPFRITQVNSFHDDTGGSTRGPNIIHVLEAGGMRAAHFGDLGASLDAGQIVQIGQLDAAMIPVGGHYTIDATQAHEVLRFLQPRVILPMHYRVDDFGFDVLAPLADFLSRCDNVIAYEGNTLELAAGTKPQTAVLRYPV